MKVGAHVFLYSLSHTCSQFTSRPSSSICQTSLVGSLQNEFSFDFCLILVIQLTRGWNEVWRLWWRGMMWRKLGNSDGQTETMCSGVWSSVTARARLRDWETVDMMLCIHFATKPWEENVKHFFNYGAEWLQVSHFTNYMNMCFKDTEITGLSLEDKKASPLLSKLIWQQLPVVLGACLNFLHTLIEFANTLNWLSVKHKKHDVNLGLPVAKKNLFRSLNNQTVDLATILSPCDESYI